MAKKDPADWWKDEVDPQDLSDFESKNGQSWESPPLIFSKNQLVVGHDCKFEDTGLVNSMLVISIKKGIPQLDEDQGLLKKRFFKANYLGTIEACRWLPEDLRGEGYIEPNLHKCVFIGRPQKSKELYVFVLLISYKPLEQLDDDDFEPV